MLEEVELRNNSDASIDVVGWFLRDEDGRVWAIALRGQVPTGSSVTIRRAGMAMNLDNGGEEIELLSSLDTVADRVNHGAVGEGTRFAP